MSPKQTRAKALKMQHDPIFEHVPRGNKTDAFVEKLMQMEEDCRQRYEILEQRSRLYKKLDNLLSRSVMDSEELNHVMQELETLRQNVKATVSA